ncbi:DNA excision repair protein ERCC-1-like [Ornithodoros turicata]|uniref:DNA excision repair protein ERCC-1-like n=1 Tax=Ornithodoros turicata TaxID=34597 RepID=UPI00313A26FE
MLPPDAKRRPLSIHPSILPCGRCYSSKPSRGPSTSTTQRAGENAGAKSVIVNARQKGNPLLKHIRNVPWEFGEIEPDYMMGQTSCALYLSLRYHNLFPEYIHKRLKSLGRAFHLRLLLVQVDVSDPHPSLRELAKIAILADCTLMLAWSPEEAGKYIETYKMYEAKPADTLLEKGDNDVFSKLVDCLTCVKSINRPDAIKLLASFKTLDRIAEASNDELALHPGMGHHKANRLHDVLHQPFLKAKKMQDK